MKKLGNLLCTAIALIAMTSCGAFKSYVADYSIGLKTRVSSSVFQFLVSKTM